MRRRRGWCRRGGRGAGAAELGGRPPGAAGAGRAWWRWPWPSLRLRGRGVGAVAGVVHRGLRGDRGERAGGGTLEGVALTRVLVVVVPTGGGLQDETDGGQADQTEQRPAGDAGQD